MSWSQSSDRIVNNQNLTYTFIYSESPTVESDNSDLGKETESKKIYRPWLVYISNLAVKYQQLVHCLGISGGAEDIQVICSGPPIYSSFCYFSSETYFTL